MQFFHENGQYFHVACSVSINGILQCGLVGQKLYNGRKRDLLSRVRPKCRPIFELVRTWKSIFWSRCQKISKKTYIVTNPHTFVIMAGLLYTVFFVTVSINPTKFKACIYLHSSLIKKKYHLNDAWGRQVGCSTRTERGRSPEKRLYCYRRVTFLKGMLSTQWFSSGRPS